MNIATVLNKNFDLECEWRYVATVNKYIRNWELSLNVNLCMILNDNVAVECECIFVNKNETINAPFR